MFTLYNPQDLDYQPPNGTRSTGVRQRVCSVWSSVMQPEKARAFFASLLGLEGARVAAYQVCVELDEFYTVPNKSNHYSWKEIKGWGAA